MRIIIVGAGLGGLSAAICFARKGHEVQLLEQRPVISAIGGGIGIRPGATRIMLSWGLREDLERISDKTPATVVHSLQTGAVDTRTVQTDLSEYPDWGTNRDILMELLYQKAKEAGVTLVFNADVVSVADDAAKACATLADGRQLEGDMILAADGIRSRIRAQVLRDLGESTEPLLSDLTLYGAHLDKQDLAQDPVLKALEDEGYIHIYIGHNGFAVNRWYGKMQIWGCLFGIKGETDQQGMWDENGDIQYVRDFFGGSCAVLTEALERINTCDRWKIAEVPALSRWTSKQGRIVLLGDSAHAMHPNAAQGFSQIIEDIGVLEYLISEDANAAADLPAITADWQRLRKPRVERIKEFARANSQRFIGQAPGTKRTEVEWQTVSLRHTKPDMHAAFNKPAFLKWVHDYDAIGEARKYLQATRSRL